MCLRGRTHWSTGKAPPTSTSDARPANASWATEGTQEVEKLRQAERHIAAATGWNSSTRVVGQLLRGLRGDRSGS